MGGVVLTDWELILYEDVEGSARFGRSLGDAYAVELWSFYKNREAFNGVTYEKFEAGLKRQRKAFRIHEERSINNQRPSIYQDDDGTTKFIHSNASILLARDYENRQLYQPINNLYQSRREYQAWSIQRFQREVNRFIRLEQFYQYYRAARRHDLHTNQIE